MELVPSVLPAIDDKQWGTRDGRDGRGARAAFAVALTWLAVLAWGCGYRSTRSATLAAGRMSVVATPGAVADDAVLGEVVFGARRALAREGVLAQGAYPHLVLEIVRLDERSEGVRAGEGVPMARGASVGLVGRARVDNGPGAPAGIDSGDVRVAGDFAAQADARRDTLTRDDALRSLARRLGETLVERVLGTPGARDEGL